MQIRWGPAWGSNVDRTGTSFRAGVFRSYGTGVQFVGEVPHPRGVGRRPKSLDTCAKAWSFPEPGELPVVDRAKPTVPPDQYLPFDFDGDGAAPLASYGSEYAFHVTTSMHGRERICQR